MTFRRTAAVALLILALLAPNSALLVQARQTPPAQATAPLASSELFERIRDEGLNRSQVMQTVSYLTDVIGPRLTNSPAMKRANNWTRDKLVEWGLEGARLEAWGPFGRGWTLRRFSAEITGPQSFPLLAFPRAWSPGLDAPLTSEVVLVEADDEAQLQKYKGGLRGKVVLAGALRELRPRFTPTASRLTDKQLLDLANAPDPALTPRQQQPPSAEQIARFRFNERKNLFYVEEGAALIVGSSPAGDGGMLQFVQSAGVPYPADTPPARRVGPWDTNAPKPIPQIALSNDHYNRLVRMIRLGERPVMSVNLEVEFDDTDPMGYNTLAEITGTDLKDEVVMLGAHLDSWHTATGATDNAAGVAVMMEAVRILKAVGAQPRRTIRIALWSGEEQGLLGSRAYVREHFGPVAAPTPTPAPAGTTAPAAAAAAVAQQTGETPKKRDARQAARRRNVPVPPAATEVETTIAPAGPQGPRFKPAYDKFNVYYNVDSGTGAIRGIYLQGNEALRPIFRQWLAPVAELKVGQNTYTAQTITLANAGGSDFLAFDAIGLPGLDFLQDEIEYETRTWHSNQDTYDRVIAEDVKQAAIVVAWVVYNSAVSDQKLPRKPLPALRQ